MMTKLTEVSQQINVCRHKSILARSGTSAIDLCVCDRGPMALSFKVPVVELYNRVYTS